ncbi:hypothetical protein LTR86_010584 [Recurvomyces mirabilis]|nr:hypothetical protein LTR86_010584 [Recurvomyces mirabilis]
MKLIEEVRQVIDADVKVRNIITANMKCGIRSRILAPMLLIAIIIFSHLTGALPLGGGEPSSTGRPVSSSTPASVSEDHPYTGLTREDIARGDTLGSRLARPKSPVTLPPAPEHNSYTIPTDADITVQIAAGAGAEFQDHLVHFGIHEIDETKWLTNDKAEWLGFRDIKKDGWFSPAGPSFSDMIRRPIDSTKLPHYLHDTIAALTFGETDSIWYSIKWVLPEKRQWLKGGRYQTAFDVQSGVIVSTVKQNPKIIVAANAWDMEHDETWRVEDCWHDIAYLTYSAIPNYDYQRGRSRKLERINEILFVVKRSSETETLVDRVRFGKYPIKSPFAQAVTFTPQDSPASFEILLGSEEGQAVAMMLLRRRVEMGWREVGEIKVWEDMGSQACLLFSIVDGSAVAEYKEYGEPSEFGANHSASARSDADAPIV